MRRLIFVLPLLVAVSTLGASEVQDLGRIDFPNSGKAEAQEPFIRGVLLLHSFEYEDAREAFLEAQKQDPDFALAYWGEAMTHNHPLWRRQDRESGKAALEKYAPTAEERLAKAPTQREKDYLAALDVLFDAPGDKKARDIAYSEAMDQLRQRYPDDLEAASFHALSILGTAQGRRDFRIYMRAGAAAEEVFVRNPRHPGAVHYLIHSYDDPVHAPLGLRAARVYAQIAPAASHAQHMISHIFVALGQWDETVDSNYKSFRVSEERAKSKGLPIYERNHHALHWLQYAYLQQGRYQKAREQLGLMEEDAAASPQDDHLSYLARMTAGYLVETGRSVDLEVELPPLELSPTSAAAYLFARGADLLRREKAGEAKEHLRLLEKRIAKAEEESADARDWKIAEIQRLELEALLALSKGDKEEAVQQLRQAVEMEDSLPFEFGPPLVVKPTHELLGEVLLEMGQPQEAVKHFKKSLDRAPRRALSLLGLARAAASSGEVATAAEARKTLDEIWAGADAELRSRDTISSLEKPSR